MIRPHIGYYLAGLTDGEGCFTIQRGRSRNGQKLPYYFCVFIINLRRDDRPLLEWLRDEVGMGSLYNIMRQGGNRKPQCHWRIQMKEECVTLVEIFERYPLRSKKRRDFEVWANAVRYWNSPRVDGFQPMAAWFEHIRIGRGYEVEELEEEVSVSAPLF